MQINASKEGIAILKWISRLQKLKCSSQKGGTFPNYRFLILHPFSCLAKTYNYKQWNIAFIKCLYLCSDHLYDYLCRKEWRQNSHLEKWCWGTDLLFPGENVLVEVVLDLLVGDVYTQLLKGVTGEILKTKDVQQANDKLFSSKKLPKWSI